MGKGYLIIDDFRKFIDKNPYIKVIELSNSGEPFFNSDMKKILRLADEKQIKISFGNGVNFNNIPDCVLEALVECNVQVINVSIDGASQKIYSIYRRNGNLDSVIKSIKKLNSLKERKNSEFPKLSWQFVLMQHNQYEAEKACIITKDLNDVRVKTTQTMKLY